MKALLSVIVIFFLNAVVYAQDTPGLVELPFLQYEAHQGARGSATRVHVLETSSSNLPIGTLLPITFPDGLSAIGELIWEYSEDPLHHPDFGSPITKTKVVSLKTGEGALELHYNFDTLIGLTFKNNKLDTYYRALIDELGAGVVENQGLSKYQCDHYPEIGSGPALQDFATNVTPPLLDYTPPLTTVQNLESNPSALNVIYIDYWGGTLTGTAWNAFYSGGNSIDYEPFDIDGNLSNFNAAERYVMYHAWLEATEDYAPFNVNVTTKQSVYNATPLANRSRIIGTTFATRDSYNICNSGCGGVAYRPSFGSGDYYSTGFTFNNTIASMGQTHSHEAGHQMGLSHDGNPPLTYYSGHGDWGPIMGAPFGKRYVQWSKGDYPNADNFEDDFSIIHGRLGTNSDDVGGTQITAEVLLTSADIIRKITPVGAVGAPNNDQDYFQINLAVESSIDLEVGPRFGLDDSENSNGETIGSDLSLTIKLFAQGNGANPISVVTPTDNLILAPNVNKLVYNGTLSPGTYFLWVDGKSPDTFWDTGFDEWGNGGEYRIKLDVTPNTKYCAGFPVTVDLNFGEAPTQGDDVILGTIGPDTIYGLGGDDLICAGNGNDVVFGGNGDDVIYAGALDDVVHGGNGADTIWAGTGDDRVFGGTDQSADNIYGQNGADELYDQGGYGYTYGGSGNDTIYSGTGGGYISGGNNADILVGSNFVDVIYGQDGADTITGWGADDFLYGGNSRDDIDGGSGDDTISGGAFVDTLVGGAGNDIIDGGTANDSIFGGAGNDILGGGEGNDSLYGGAGDDTLNGGPDNDMLNGQADTDVCNGGTGVDTVTVTCESSTGIPRAQVQSIEPPVHLLPTSPISELVLLQLDDCDESPDECMAAKQRVSLK